MGSDDFGQPSQAVQHGAGFPRDLTLPSMRLALAPHLFQHQAQVSICAPLTDAATQSPISIFSQCAPHMLLETHLDRAIDAPCAHRDSDIVLIGSGVHDAVDHVIAI